MRMRFGPAGMCEQAASDKVKSTEKLLEYLAERGLDAFEYQCGRGVNLGEAKALSIGSKSRETGIEISLHAPYYTSLASAEQEKRDNSVKYILQSARAVSLMGGRRIVVHPGGLGKMSRELAAEAACETLLKAQRALDEEGLEDVIICPEVMGKINQLGTVDEVIEMCRVDERMLPCVDFGHLNSRTHGAIRSKEDYIAVIAQIERELGQERARKMHIHFSKIEYSKGGEVRHLTFADTQFGPDYMPLVDSLSERKMYGTVICESAGTQTADSLEMKKEYDKLEGAAI